MGKKRARTGSAPSALQRCRGGRFSVFLAWGVTGLVGGLIAHGSFFRAHNNPDDFTEEEAAERRYGYKGNVSLCPVYHSQVNVRKSYFGPEYNAEHAYCGELEAFEGGRLTFSRRQHVATFRFISHPDVSVNGHTHEFYKGLTEYHADWGINGRNGKSKSFEGKSFEENWAHYCGGTPVSSGYPP